MVGRVSDEPGRLAICGACGAAILVVTTTSCAKIKLDREPVSDGDVVIGEVAGVEVAVRVDAAHRAFSQIDGTPLYRPHIQTCTRAVAERDRAHAGAPRDPVVDRPHPFSRRTSGESPVEETESSEQP